MTSGWIVVYYKPWNSVKKGQNMLWLARRAGALGRQTQIGPLKEAQRGAAVGSNGERGVFLAATGVKWGRKPTEQNAVGNLDPMNRGD